MKALKYLIFPLIIFSVLVWILANKEALHYEFFNGSILYSNAVFLKLLLTVILPLLLINITLGLKPKSGIYFGQMKNSFFIAVKSFSLVGPACLSFVIIGFLGWSFTSWHGAITATVFFSTALVFIPKVTRKLSTRDEVEKKNLKIIYLLATISTLTFIVLLVLTDLNPILRNIFYFFFIVAVGEELLFRGYLQSSFNLFFGKYFKIYDVRFGWGLILSSILFGIIHALVVSPIAWPWMLFTFIGGLILGFVREKDGSLLAPILLHFLMDFPLIFIT